MNSRDLASRIALTGMKPDYTVRTSGFDACGDITVPSTRIGNAIVRALRTEAARRPDLFPQRQRGKESGLA